MGNKAANIDQSYVKQYRAKLGEMIRIRRMQTGLDEKQLGEKIGVTPATIKKIEAGEFPASIDDFIMLSIALGLKITLY